MKGEQMANEKFGGQGLITQGAAPSHGLDSQSFARGAIQYDNPFMDMTSTFIPRTIKSMN